MRLRLLRYLNCWIYFTCMLNKERKSIEKVSKTILDKLYPHLFTRFKIQKFFKCVINFPQFLSPNSHFNSVLASKEVPFGYRMSLKGIKRFETYAHLAFSAGTHFISDIPCNRNTKRMVDYFADTTCFITLNWLLTIVSCSTCCLIKTQYDGTIDKYCVQNKKSNKKLYIISWNALDAFVWPFDCLPLLSPLARTDYTI